MVENRIKINGDGETRTKPDVDEILKWVTEIERRVPKKYRRPWMRRATLTAAALTVLVSMIAGARMRVDDIIDERIAAYQVDHSLHSVAVFRGNKEHRGTLWSAMQFNIESDHGEIAELLPDLKTIRLEPGYRYLMYFNVRAMSIVFGEGDHASKTCHVQCVVGPGFRSLIPNVQGRALFTDTFGSDISNRSWFGAVDAEKGPTEIRFIVTFMDGGGNQQWHTLER